MRAMFTAVHQYLVVHGTYVIFNLCMGHKLNKICRWKSYSIALRVGQTPSNVSLFFHTAAFSSLLA